MRFESLEALLSLLESHRDEKYRRFNESLIPGAENSSMGVRMPVLQRLAKDFCKDNWQDLLTEAQTSTVYEIVMLRGLVTAYAPVDFDTKLRLVAAHVPSITNWALCDCFCSALKGTKRHLPEAWDFLQDYVNSNEVWPLRFGIVMLMDHFLVDPYIDDVLSIFISIRHHEYYVNMAQAWAMSVAFVKYREKTLSLLEAKTLSPWVQNKTIQKCRESYRVSPKDKEMLLALRL